MTVVALQPEQSICGYPSNYRPLPIRDQIFKVSDTFSLSPKRALKFIDSDEFKSPLPPGAESWFAFPAWQSLAPTYDRAVHVALSKIGQTWEYSLAVRLKDATKTYQLIQKWRSIKFWKKIRERQGGDIVLLPAQFGMLHRGESSQPGRLQLANNEFGLGVFATSVMIFNHLRYRFSLCKDLYATCCGDGHGSRVLSKTPHFHFDFGGLWLD